jgi:hypothetical protein
MSKDSKTDDNSKVEEYSHVCHLCSVYLPGSVSRLLCENNIRAERENALGKMAKQVDAIYRFLALTNPDFFND